jgi:hypothetical protein
MNDNLTTNASNEAESPAFLVGAFKPVHCQKDYETDTVTVQFTGKFDGVKAWEYLKQSYPSFEGRDIVAFSEPSNFRGLENMGEAVFKHCP